MSQSVRPKALSKPRAKSDSDDDLEVQLSVLSDKWNAILTVFFRETAERARVYWLLASLSRHHSVRTANAMAFDLFLALVPMLGLAGWTASLVVRSSTGDVSASSILTDLTPAQIDGFIGEHFAALSKAHLAPLAGVAGWWLVSSAFYTMMSVFQETFECRDRSWLEKRLVSLGFALLAMVALGVGGGLGVLATVTPPDFIELIFKSLRYLGLVQVSAVLVSLLVTASFFAFLYRYAISRRGRKRRTWPGAWLATILGALATVGLGFYASNIARYALFYGGLAAIVVVLVWLWLWSTVILLGAEINVALEDVDEARASRADAEQDAQSADSVSTDPVSTDPVSTDPVPTDPA